MQLEIITGRPPTVLPYLEEDFWKTLPDKTSAEFARFLKLARDGHPYHGPMMIAGRSKQPPEHAATLKHQQRVDVERSVKYAREEFGVGLRS